jgi:hypothetical protein
VSGWWWLVITLFVWLGMAMLFAPWIGARLAGDGRSKTCERCGAPMFGAPPAHRPEDMVSCWTRREDR